MKITITTTDPVIIAGGKVLKRYRIADSKTGHLVGLISETSEGGFRVEMLRIDVRHGNIDRAIGFAYGVAAATKEGW